LYTAPPRRASSALLDGRVRPRVLEPALAEEPVAAPARSPAEHPRVALLAVRRVSPLHVRHARVAA
jgi:hypothetical protein